MKKENRNFERLLGDRPGRNVCISGRITDKIDKKIDDWVREKDLTRSKVVSEALKKYMEARTHKDISLFPPTQNEYWDSTLLTILVLRDKEGIYKGTVPSLKGCASHGTTLEELFINLSDAIEAALNTL